MDPAMPVAEALAIRDGRIALVGTTDEVRATVGDETRVVDLEGRTVVPGLVDCHVHVAGQAAMSHHLDLRDFFTDVPDLPSLLGSLSDRARSAPPGTWVTAQAGPLQEARMKEGRRPTRHELDRAVPDHPAFVLFGGHITVANSRALALAGIDRDTVAPPRGAIDFDESGEPTGVLRETAQRLVKDYAPPHGRLDEAVESELRRAASRGVTSIHEITNGPDELATYQRLEASGDLPVRVQMLIRVIESRFDPDVLLDLGIADGFGSDLLRIGGIKISVDGGFTGRNAAFYEPLEWGDEGTAMIRVEREELTETIRKHHEAGIRACVHAMGDRAMDMVLDAFDEVLGDEPSAIRHRVEHLGNWQLDRQRLMRVKSLGLIPVPNPVFLHFLGEVTLNALGKERAVDAWPLRSILDAGIPLVFGTDAPAYWPIDPLRDMGTAVTRRTRTGSVIEPGQSVDPLEALKAITVNAAEVGGVADRLGRLVPGMLADIAVLDDDPLQCPTERISETQVALTIMNGRVTFENL